jgi:hypothetical protein
MDGRSGSRPWEAALSWSTEFVAGGRRPRQAMTYRVHTERRSVSVEPARGFMSQLTGKVILVRQLTGKVILVVGATSDIGRAVASRVAAESAALVVPGRRAELGARVCVTSSAPAGKRSSPPATRPERATSRQQLRSPSIGSVTSMAPSTRPAACWQPVHSLTYPPPTGRPN